MPWPHYALSRCSRHFVRKASPACWHMSSYNWRASAYAPWSAVRRILMSMKWWRLLVRIRRLYFAERVSSPEAVDGLWRNTYVTAINTRNVIILPNAVYQNQPEEYTAWRRKLFRKLSEIILIYSDNRPRDTHEAAILMVSKAEYIQHRFR